ncbi:MAG: hypothetical protein L6V91_06025 [Bacilli bacterium]|nr:MAG: hypothetical protein L6V91_06025 [Bacilli bacterium]
MNKYEDVVGATSNLIYAIINKYFKGYDQDDLYQVGVIGVIKAYDNYKRKIIILNFLLMLINTYMEKYIVI